MVEVEIYDMREMTADMAPEMDAEAIAALEALSDSGLELSGQIEMIHGTDTSATRNHYDQMTAAQAFVARNLFPTVTLVDRYDAGPIPVRVLKEIAFAKDHFAFLYVLHRPPAEITDPILVGTDSKVWDRITDGDKPRLIARWGDALAPWTDLYAQAMTRYRESLKRQISAVLRRLQLQLDMLDECDPENLSADISPYPHMWPFPQ